MHCLIFFLHCLATQSARADTLRDDGWLEIHVVDVGQGDGIWIHTFDDSVHAGGRYLGRNIVVDGGPVAADARNPFLAYVMNATGGRAVIDALIITHPHVDHYPGATGIFHRFDVCDYYDPGYPDNGVEYQRFLDLAAHGHCGDHHTTMHVGQGSFGTPDWGNELKVEFLYSYPGAPDGLGHGNSLINNASIVFKLTYGTQSMLFMGDAEGKERGDGPDTPKYVEARLLAKYPASALKATVLKVAHHGSETSSTLPFIRAVDPAIVVVSSGRKSFSGTYLPDRSTLERYCHFNAAIRIYRTDQNDEAEGLTNANDADHDDIVIRMNGKRTEVVAHEAGKPFVPSACSP
jgi:competence protein ComEC